MTRQIVRRQPDQRPASALRTALGDQGPFDRLRADLLATHRDTIARSYTRGVPAVLGTIAVLLGVGGAGMVDWSLLPTAAAALPGITIAAAGTVFDRRTAHHVYVRNLPEAVGRLACGHVPQHHRARPDPIDQVGIRLMELMQLAEQADDAGLARDVARIAADVPSYDPEQLPDLEATLTATYKARYEHLVDDLTEQAADPIDDAEQFRQATIATLHADGVDADQALDDAWRQRPIRSRANDASTGKPSSGERELPGSAGALHDTLDQLHEQLNPVASAFEQLHGSHRFDTHRRDEMHESAVAMLRRARANSTLYRTGRLSISSRSEDTDGPQVPAPAARARQLRRRVRDARDTVATCAAALAHVRATRPDSLHDAEQLLARTRALHEASHPNTQSPGDTVVPLDSPDRQQAAG